MALKNQPEFEQAEETTNAKASAGVEATKAIAKAATTAVSTATKMVLAHSGAKDVFETTTVAALSRATPRITAEQGALCKNRTGDLGKSIIVELVSWNHRFAIGCGEEKMTDEMKQLFRVSYDNKTIDGENDVTIVAYLEGLKAQGYDKAKSTPYADIFGFLVEANGKEIPADERELVLVQASQTSLGNFTAFCVSRGILESRGAVQASPMIQITAEAKTNGTNKYTNMSFAALKAK